MKLISKIVDYLLGYTVSEIKADDKVYVPCKSLFGTLNTVSYSEDVLKYDYNENNSEEILNK